MIIDNEMSAVKIYQKVHFNVTKVFNAKKNHFSFWDIMKIWKFLGYYENIMKIK